MTRRRAAELVLLAALALSSCGEREEESGGTEPTESTAVPVGTVEGVIRLAEGSEVPSYAQSPFATSAAGELPTSCTPPQLSDRQPLGDDPQRGLANVAVGAMGDPTRWLPRGEPVTHELRIHDCRFGPRTIVGTLGDQLSIVNEVSYPFMPQFGMGFLRAVLPDEALHHPLEVAGTQSLQCAFTAPCGRAEIMVFQSPVHTVSGVGGTFRIENAPADQELTIVAYHPLIREGRATTRVSPGGTAHVEIVVESVPDPTPGPRPRAFDPGAPEYHPPTEATPSSETPATTPTEPTPTEPTPTEPASSGATP